LITDDEAGEATRPSRCAVVVVGADDAERKQDARGRVGQLTRRRACIIVKFVVCNGVLGTRVACESTGGSGRNQRKNKATFEARFPVEAG